jgi:hypothetical protein
VTTNPYFKFNPAPSSETDLVQDLIIEAIQIYGIDLLYIPREYVNIDHLYNEDPLSYFPKYHEMEMYIKKNDNFGGEGDLLGKFGLEIRDTSIFTVARKRFLEVVNDQYLRPEEGALVYFPYNKLLFKIMMVEDKSVFWQLGELFVWDLHVELFEYSHEKLDTGVPEVDEVADNYAYSVILTLAAGAAEFEYKETIYQGIDLAHATGSATVVSQDGNLLKIRDIAGKFKVANGPIKGASGQSRNMASIDMENDVNDILDDNKEIHDEEPGVMDFTEKNPFSENEDR